MKKRISKAEQESEEKRIKTYANDVKNIRVQIGEIYGIQELKSEPVPAFKRNYQPDPRTPVMATSSVRNTPYGKEHEGKQ